MKEFNFKEYNKLSFVGDLHGKLQEFVSSIENVEDMIFVLTGDNNLGKQQFEKDIDLFANLEYKLAKNNNYVCLIRGNHDNPKYFKSKSTFRSLMSEDAPHFILIPDYSIIYVSNYTILCIGGARSIDRTRRIKDYTWWTNENVKKPDDDFYSVLEENNIKVDIVVSHSAPLFAQPLEFSNDLKHYNSYLMNSYALYDKNLKNDVYKERLLLKGLYERLNNKNHIKLWAYGHYHKDIETTYNKTKMISLSINQKYNM